MPHHAAQADANGCEPRPMIDDLLREVDRRAGSAQFTLLRPRRGDWTAVVFRDDPNPDRVLYATRQGDSGPDAVRNLLDDPTVPL